jgi:hypothetical protein
MEPYADDEIRRLLRLKRYEQPPPDYFENFLLEFRRRQRDELLREPLWSICVDRARDFVFRRDVRPLASPGIAVAVACAALISIRLYQQPDTTQLAVQGSPVPNIPSNTKRELDSIPRFHMQPTLLPGSRDVPLLPIDSDQFVELRLEP